MKDAIYFAPAIIGVENTSSNRKYIIKKKNNKKYLLLNKEKIRVGEIAKIIIIHAIKNVILK
jgi:hypothetical protein